MKTFVIFLGLFFGSFVGVNGQGKELDSLKKELQIEIIDSKKLIILIELVKFSKSNLEECEKYLIEAKNITNKLKDSYSQVKFYEGQINFDRFNDNHKQAIENSEKALIICKKENYQKEYYEILLLKALSFQRGNSAKETEKLLNEVKENSKFLAKISTSKMYIGFGLLYVEQGKFDLSIGYFEKAIKLAKELNNKNLTASYLSILFIPYYKNGNLEKALETCLKADKLLLLSGDSVNAIINSGNLATVYTDLKQFDKSTEIILKSIENQQNLGFAIGDDYDKLANNYSYKGDINMTEKYYKMAIKEHEKEENKIGMGRAKSNLGNHYIEIRKYTEAIPLLLESIELIQENNPSDLAVSLTKLAEAYMAVKKYDSASLYIKKSIELCKQYEIINVLRENYILAFYLQIETSKIPKLEQNQLSTYFELVTNLDSAIAINKYKETIADKLTKYETEKKDLENAKLKAENELVSQAQQQQFFIFTALFAVLVGAGGFLYYRNQQKTKFVLQAKETEKVQAELEAVTQDRADLSRQIHDRVLSPIKGLQIKHPEMATDVEKVYEQVQLFSHRLAAYDTELITARLYEYVAMYANSFVVKPSFTGYEALMKQIPQKVATELCIIADIAMLNAYQHAQATEVYLNFDCNSQQIMLSVSDNGIGFDKQKVEASTGRGLKNMQNRADQIKAKLEIESDQNEGLGTKIRVTLKM